MGSAGEDQSGKMLYLSEVDTKGLEGKVILVTGMSVSNAASCVIPI